MQHLELRCKHCGIRYTYCTYGNSDGCSKPFNTPKILGCDDK